MVLTVSATRTLPLFSSSRLKRLKRSFGYRLLLSLSLRFIAPLLLCLPSDFNILKSDHQREKNDFRFPPLGVRGPKSFFSRISNADFIFWGLQITAKKVSPDVIK
jgi:hypothetical protein